jgi:hypothetical protein
MVLLRGTDSQIVPIKCLDDLAKSVYFTLHL